MTGEFSFGQRIVGSEQSVLIISEIGINHEGDASLCMEMIHASAEAGADSIKLQTLDASRNYAPGTISHELFSSATLSLDETAQAFELSRKLGMDPFTTAGDLRTIDDIDELNPAGWKVSSGLLSCYPVVRAVCKKGRSVLMSTGLATMDEIRVASAIIQNAGVSFGLLQCTSLYPTPDQHVNLRMIQRLSDEFNVPAGYSDHTTDEFTPAYSVAAGACVIEKHFTITPERPSFDHPISLTPERFSRMVQEIRRAETLRGNATKELTDETTEARARMNRNLGTLVPLSAGEVLTPDNLGFLRFADPEGCVATDRFDDFLNNKLVRDLPAFSPIREHDIER